MIQQSSRLKPAETQGIPVCRHHWIIEASTGPVSRGICQLCEEVRVFKNYIESAPWGEDPSAVQSDDRSPVPFSAEDVEELEEA